MKATFTAGSHSERCPTLFRITIQGFFKRFTGRRRCQFDAWPKDYSLTESLLGRDLGSHNIRMRNTCQDQRFEEMIEAGWDVLSQDFHEIAILKWRKQASEFVTELLGSDHAYTQQLRDRSSKAWQTTVLSGIGVLGAAKESLLPGIVPVGNLASI